jgi:hypothetical protein
MWATKSRVRYDRIRQRYPSDLLNPKWDMIAPLISPPRAASTSAPRTCARSPTGRAHSTGGILEDA